MVYNGSEPCYYSSLDTLLQLEIIMLTLSNPATLTANTEEFVSAADINGISFTVYNKPRSRGKFLCGVAVLQLSNGNFVEAQFSTGQSAVTAAKQMLRDKRLLARWTANAIQLGAMTKADRIVNVDFILCDYNLHNDQLREAKLALTAGFESVYGFTGKHGN